jgi:hypothetical protein
MNTVDRSVVIGVSIFLAVVMIISSAFSPVAPKPELPRVRIVTVAYEGHVYLAGVGGGGVCHSASCPCYGRQYTNEVPVFNGDPGIMLPAPSELGAP